MMPSEPAVREPVEHFISQNVTYVLETEGHLLVIENVPARVSQETGEQLFSPETVEQIQKTAWTEKSQFVFWKRQSTSSLPEMTIEAVFLDRDGVLNPHIPGGYLLRAEDAVVLPGVAAAVRRLNDANIKVIVISNQQGVGKGLMTRADLDGVERRIGEVLKREAGAFLDGCYYSVELASANSPRRKPQPGMLLEAAQDFGLTLARTVFAGDSATDIQAGHAAGVGYTVLLLSGGIRAYAEGNFQPAPDLVFPDLASLVNWALEQSL